MIYIAKIVKSAVFGGMGYEDAIAEVEPLMKEHRQASAGEKKRNEQAPTAEGEKKPNEDCQPRSSDSKGKKGSGHS